MNQDIYGRALAEARSELVGLRMDHDRLAKRIAQLEAFIANTEPLIPPASMMDSLPLVLAQAEVFEERQAPIWKAIVLSINGKGNRFTVRDAIEGLARIGRPIESPNRSQVVRSVLTKKTDQFRQIGPGLFALRNDRGEMEEAT